MVGKLSFGTAGIRCRMEAGFARLNDLTIIQVSHGMAKHIIQVFGAENLKGVAVGFDGRYNSRRFADLASNVFTQNGMKVHLFSDYVPTPVVSFAAKALNCDAGLMITASHNPKEDNGYKAYWTDHIIEDYYKSESSMCYCKELNQQSAIKFTYSAFHGVGSKFARRLFAEYGLPEANIFYVKEQDEPDPTFPTVPFPNPEEGLKVLKLCLETADSTGSSMILANDPDADRLQLAEKQANGDWRIFTGNEMGTILTWWIWKNWRAANPDADLSKVYILNSAVSSQIVKTIAQAEGFRNEITLTGFKWMGNVAEKLRSQGNQVILAWEESIGFMAGHTLDKDGVSAAAIFAEIANYLKKETMLMSEQLYKIYNKYGFHLVRSSYWIVPQAPITKQIFGDIRKNLDYPKQIGSNNTVKYVRDLTTGYDNEQPDNKAILPLSTSSEMITFTLDSGSIVTLRASGTEPKIKYYIELKTEPGKSKEDLGDILQTLEELEQNVVNTLLQPVHYGLKSRENY
uniref:Phosphoglucomutase-2 n=1 Tax=Ditylenchus dipsaci TaxID=166011 RepID=A0A915ELV9_9BILA